jgi:hypothetical protein
LISPIYQHRDDAQEEKELPRQRPEAAPQKAEQNSPDQEGEIDSDVPLAKSPFVTQSFIAIKGTQSAGIAKEIHVGIQALKRRLVFDNLFKGDDIYAGGTERIKALLAG